MKYFNLKVQSEQVMGPGPMGLDLIIFLTKMGMGDMQAYLRMSPYPPHIATYVYN